MFDFAVSSTLQALLGVTILLVVAYAGFWVAMRLRPTTSTPDTNVDAIAENFEEMELEGDIDEAELRKIKAVLGKMQNGSADV